jgi:hypothetical protein
MDVEMVPILTLLLLVLQKVLRTLGPLSWLELRLPSKEATESTFPDVTTAGYPLPILIQPLFILQNLKLTLCGLQFSRVMENIPSNLIMENS